jgi:hypothetical protein
MPTGGTRSCDQRVTMTSRQIHERRATIVRRWAAYRIRRAQREIWKRRRGHSEEDPIDEGVVGFDVLADLPDGLLG